MAIETHIRQLEEKHRRLEAELGKMLNHPGCSQVEITDMKRLKLQLKDRISLLRKKSGQA